MTPAEFRAQAHRIADWLADYREHVAELPVMPPVLPGGIRAQLPAAPPEAGESFDAVFADFAR
ncbi:MAG TPA: amino acid decarboxylase, partial [Gemmatimonadales bacterium]|nr:amino acid decarboxylase [Gemmatimonadales bacterium]